MSCEYWASMYELRTKELRVYDIATQRVASLSHCELRDNKLRAKEPMSC